MRQAGPTQHGHGSQKRMAQQLRRVKICHRTFSWLCQLLASLFFLVKTPEDFYFSSLLSLSHQCPG